MTLSTLNNGETGLSIRNKINANCSELYDFTTPRLAKWWEGGISGKKIVVCGDSTSDIAGNGTHLYTRFNFWLNNGSHGTPSLKGVTVEPRGSSGQTSAGFLGSQIQAAIDDAGDLYIYSFGINDVREGNTDKPTLKANIITAVDQIRAALPNACIVLRMPNPLLTTQNANYIIPIESAPAYSAILREVYRELADRWPDVLLFDTHKLIFGEEDRASDRLIAPDAIHPQPIGYFEIVDNLVKIVGYTEQGNGSSRRLWDNEDWAIYPEVLLDTNKFELLATGTVSASAANYFDLGLDKDQIHTFKQGVIVWQDGEAPFRTTKDGNNNGGVAAATRFLETAPVTLTGTRRVRVFRDKYYNTKEIALRLNDPVKYPVAIPIDIYGAGNGYLNVRILENKNTDNFKWMSPDDEIVLMYDSFTETSTVISMSSVTSIINHTQTTHRLLIAGDQSVYSGLHGFYFSQTDKTRANVRNESADFTATVEDDLLLCNANGGPIVPGLPDPEFCWSMELTAIKTDGSVNAVTFNGIVLANQDESQTIRSDGTTWRNL